MLVKICGITTEKAAQAAVEAGADFIGFVFAPSSRKITVEKAKEISTTLSPTVHKVGVFVNETVENIASIAEAVNLDYIQLHGDEPASIAEQLPYKIIKAFLVKGNMKTDITNYPCDYYLVDSPKAGSGETFDWKLIHKLSLDHRKLILAGGLSSENISQAIKQVNPVGADVSSGVETNGKKDNEKIKEFIHLCKNKEGKDDIDGNIYDA
ncbi:phosphoribosylanthranilate isomerase [Virgibacillus sp. SK37]|uniref:phosphoribosylanthranilate isomerase n=1 Tax=Virgibacillus sp. SK37 TaxID=403957 RepID=UPI0004D1EE3B|nr:phosphoribosylanthranilate isomerase [Virgibacillus sp. SK37]AIF42277.1 N-(5'-phosphoribosyl)anthranilate isomerase [Virgibacillus sp. SK37]